MKVRLNFSVSISLYDDLSSYCNSVGRTPTDVVRQLILEYLDNDIPSSCFEVSGRERRTSLLLPYGVLKVFENKAALLGMTKSRLVSSLIRYFLSSKKNVDFDVSREQQYRAALLKLVNCVNDNFCPGKESFVKALEEATNLLGIE